MEFQLFLQAGPVYHLCHQLMHQRLPLSMRTRKLLIPRTLKQTPVQLQPFDVPQQASASLNWLLQSLGRLDEWLQKVMPVKYPHGAPSNSLHHIPMATTPPGLRVQWVPMAPHLHAQIRLTLLIQITLAKLPANRRSTPITLCHRVASTLHPDASVLTHLRITSPDSLRLPIRL